MTKLLKRPGVGVGVMIMRGGRVLLGKRHSDPQKASSELKGEGIWTMPGGKLDFGEELAEAAYREAFEETDIKIDKAKLKIISVTNDIKGEKHFVTIGFLCQDFKGEPKVMEPEEIRVWKWFALDKLPFPIYFPSEKILKIYQRKKKSFLEL